VFSDCRDAVDSTNTPTMSGQLPHGLPHVPGINPANMAEA